MVRQVLCSAALGVLLLFTSASASASELVKKKNDLTIRIDGKDIVVTTEVWANNSPHVVLPTYSVDMHSLKICLNYVLIQNRDLLVRSRKRITVTWRLTGMAIIPHGPFTYRVDATNLTLSTDELDVLLPRLKSLQQSGQNRLPLTTS